MLVIPVAEKKRFETIIEGEAKRYGLRPNDYLRKIWYHQEAARLGEYVAISLVEVLVETLLESKDATTEQAEHIDPDYHLEPESVG